MVCNLVEQGLEKGMVTTASERLPDPVSLKVERFDSFLRGKNGPREIIPSDKWHKSCLAPGCRANCAHRWKVTLEFVAENTHLFTGFDKYWEGSRQRQYLKSSGLPAILLLHYTSHTKSPCDLHPYLLHLYRVWLWVFFPMERSGLEYVPTIQSPT